MKMLSEEVVFGKVRELLTEWDTASIQKDSFNAFLHHRLTRIIEEEPTLMIPLPDGRTYCVKFGQIFVDYPYIVDNNRTIRYITPNEARLRELTYSSLVSINVRTSIVTTHDGVEKETENKEFFKVHLCRIPMMVGASKCNLYGKNKKQRRALGECEYDNGGYFIIKGKERVLVTQERMNYNVVYVFEQKPTSKFLLIAEIRSMSEETGHSVLVKMKLCNDIGLRTVVQIPYIVQEIPVGYLFRAYGLDVSTVERLLGVLFHSFEDDPAYRKIRYQILRDADIIQSSEKALQLISQYAIHTITKERRIPYVVQILNNELFPHLGIMSTRCQKVCFLGHMVYKLCMTHLGHRRQDDRDHINNKRYETSGHLMAELFRTLFKRSVRAMEPQLAKRNDILVVMSRMNILSLGIKHCFSTGNWGIPKSSYIRTGVSQILNRLTFNAFLSHLRRIVIPIGKEGKNTKIRQIHPSQIGFVCPSETPEGHSAGIVKNMTVICSLTPRTETSFLRMIVERMEGVCGDFSILLQTPPKTDPLYKIFLNGNWIGFSWDTTIFQRLIDHRHQMCIPHHVSISMNERYEIMIFGDEGRLMRPLWNMEALCHHHDKVVEWTIRQCFEKNVIQWLDSYEIENTTIAMHLHEQSQWSFHYCEIHPSLLVSLCVGLIPYVDHTQAPRITYHASMGKQAIGMFATTHAMRTDTIMHLLMYPEKPLVKTHISEITGCDDLASGSNLIVAIAMYSGFNQEDSVILNQSAIERGLLRSIAYKTVVVEERKKSTLLSEVIELPALDIRTKSFNFQKLDPATGIVRVGVFVGSGDVLVGRIQVKSSKTGRDEKSDASVIVKTGDEGYVDKVFVSTSPDGYTIVKIRIRSYKIPEIGDKVCSRNAQKGTVGITLSQEDMPFTSSGIVPDIIINPLCLPSRMTINQVIECVAAKCAVRSSRFKYATAFSSHSHRIAESLTDELHQLGFQRHGLETMYNGCTGTMLATQIFIGPTYYQRLKHLVSAKIHARNHGSIQALTRQPLEGRSRDGGLRFGEMERDCMISHGVSRFLVERLFDMSDRFTIPLCKTCGSMPNEVSQCMMCKKTNIVRVPIPYACKLLFQELGAMGIKIQLHPSS